MLGLLILITLSLFLSACGIVKDTFAPKTETPSTKTEKAIEVEVVVESDGHLVNDLKVNVNARKNPQSVSFDTIEVPYKEKFAVTLDVIFPIKSTKVEASVAKGAKEVSCKIFYDGKEVATHISKGDQAKAVCEKKLRIGPQ